MTLLRDGERRVGRRPRELQNLVRVGAERPPVRRLEAKLRVAAVAELDVAGAGLGERPRAHELAPLLKLLERGSALARVQRRRQPAHEDRLAAQRVDRRRDGRRQRAALAAEDVVLEAVGTVRQPVLLGLRRQPVQRRARRPERARPRAHGRQIHAPPRLSPLVTHVSTSGQQRVGAVEAVGGGGGKGPPWAAPTAFCRVAHCSSRLCRTRRSSRLTSRPAARASRPRRAVNRGGRRRSSARRRTRGAAGARAACRALHRTLFLSVHRWSADEKG